MSFELSAVVVSAGRSSRFNRSISTHQNISKQLVSWGGLPLFAHTLEALFQLPISELALVIRAEEEDQIRSALDGFTFSEKIKVCYGGKRRQDSVRNGLETLAPTKRVLIHDGARPFLPREFLESLDRLSREHRAVIPVLPVFETLKQIDSLGRVVKTHDRNSFVRAQTPQFFEFELIRKIHEHLKNTQIEFTDDAAMMEYSGFDVQTMMGSPENVKVTIPEDLPQREVRAQ